MRACCVRAVVVSVLVLGLCAALGLRPARAEGPSDSWSVELGLALGQYWYEGKAEVQREYSSPPQSMMLDLGLDFFPWRRLGVGVRYLGAAPVLHQFAEIFDIITFGLTSTDETYQSMGGYLRLVHIRPWLADDGFGRFQLTYGEGPIRYALLQPGKSHDDRPDEPAYTAETEGTARLAEVSYGFRLGSSKRMLGRWAIGVLNTDLEPIDTTQLTRPYPINGPSSPMRADGTGAYLSFALIAAF